MTFIRMLALLSIFFVEIAEAEPGMQLLFPIDGLVLTEGYDVSPKPGLQVEVIGVAPSGKEVSVNGVQATVASPSFIDYNVGFFKVEPGQSSFVAVLDVSGPMFDIDVALDGTVTSTALCYYWDDPTKTFSITIDDAIDLFAELADGDYSTIFEHPTFWLLKRMHVDFGAVFSMYLFKKGNHYPEFDLEKMPDRYKEEWEENSNWLRLGFHAKQLTPSYPYHNAPFEAKTDFLTIYKEIIRFAGSRTWDQFLRPHYWSGSEYAVATWMDFGIVKGLYGAVPGQKSYYLTPEQTAILASCDYWRDHSVGANFIQTDLWIEHDFKAPELTTTSRKIAIAKMDSVLNNPYGSHNIQIFTHESFLFRHAASWDVPKRIEDAIVYLVERGYVPRFDADHSPFDSLPEMRISHPSPVYDAGLLFNCPNPFVNNTEIVYQLGSPGTVRLDIYNLLGQRIWTRINESQVPGVHQVLWDGRDHQGTLVGAGVYLVSFQYPGGVKVRRVLSLN